MSWQPLTHFKDPSVPKLDNLRRAAEAGLRVPPTMWLRPPTTIASAPPDLGPAPWIIRSGSPTEDTRTTSNAGQLLSLPVHHASDFADALARVIAALPLDANQAPLGAVFVQPLVQAEEAGVAFFDGFYFERTLARGGNESLTSGQQRGEVKRGHLVRGDAWSDWLGTVDAVFGLDAGGDERLDLEFARDAGGFILLQVRPALFPLARNPTLSLANHKEILGDPPSPWMVSALVEAGRDLSFPALADRRIQNWDEAYAVEVGERAWLNVSFWYRWMDYFGLPRTMVTEGVGGHSDNPADARVLPRRFVASIPRLAWFQFCCLRTVPGLARAFRVLDQQIESARSLADLHAVTVAGLTLALRGNFAINAALSGLTRIRRMLRIPGTARVVTQEMMDEYSRLAERPVAEREFALDQWLERFGHRGPLESDLSRPRFNELRPILLRDTLQAQPPAERPRQRGWSMRLFRPLFWMDETREWFRDSMMRRWQAIRMRCLAEGQRLVDSGRLNSASDLFWLRPVDWKSDGDLRVLVDKAKARVEAVHHVELPQSAPRDEIQAILARASQAQAARTGCKLFPGIPLTSAIVEGRAIKADDLVTLLAEGGERLGPDAILVVPTLEPSWAVIFPRVGGVVAELGGELSHASILLRESRRPAIVNCQGIYREIQNGDRLRLDGERGVVEIQSSS